MKYDFLVLGGEGMQGRIVTKDLLQHGHSVFIADLYKSPTDPNLKNPKAAFEYIDLRDTDKTAALIKKVKPCVVINCAEGDWNLNVYYAALEAKVHVIDLGSEIPMTEDQIVKLGPLFRDKNLTAITGCGSTPGINNVMLRYATDFFDVVEEIEAGFAWDSNIKDFVVPFSIQSIIEEFTDPAPIIEDRVWKTVSPLDHIETREFREIGPQQCFLVRHPETLTFYLHYKKEGLKTMRYYAGFPNHSAETIKGLIKAGFHKNLPVNIEEKPVPRLDFLTALLRELPRPEGYTEKENLWVIVRGIKNGSPKEVMMECIVNTLPGWEDAGCNIDTGVPASIIARMINDGTINFRGSFAPGMVVPFKEFFKELRKYEMIVHVNGKVVN